MGEWMEVRAADGHSLSVYKAVPTGEAKGALVVVQEIFGVNAHIRSVADRFAALGYAAVAPALFDRIEPGIELKYEGADMEKAYALYGKLDPKTALLDVAAAFATTQGTGKGTAVVGFCYGGMLSWLAATRGKELGMEPSCCVGYYPGGVGQVATEEPLCPVLLQFGADDTHIGPEQIGAVREAHPEVEIEIYTGAQHGFNCDARASYNADAAKLAWDRTLGFLAQHVG